MSSIRSDTNQSAYMRLVSVFKFWVYEKSRSIVLSKKRKTKAVRRRSSLFRSLMVSYAIFTYAHVY